MAYPDEKLMYLYNEYLYENDFMSENQAYFYFIIENTVPHPCIDWITGLEFAKANRN